MKVKIAQSCQTLRSHGLYSPWNSPGQNSGVGSQSLLQEVFPTQGSNPGLLHCRQILYRLSYQRSPRILEWIAYPFSRGHFQPRNGTKIFCIVGRLSRTWLSNTFPFIYTHTHTYIHTHAQIIYIISELLLLLLSHSVVPDSLHPIDCSPPGSSVHAIFQVRILAWAAISSSKGSSWNRDQSHIFCASYIRRQILYHCTSWKADNLRVGHPKIWHNGTLIIFN